MKRFQAGDMAILKGSPHRRLAIKRQEAVCQWLDDHGRVHEASFPIELLEHVQDVKSIVNKNYSSRQEILASEGSGCSVSGIAERRAG